LTFIPLFNELYRLSNQAKISLKREPQSELDLPGCRGGDGIAPNFWVEAAQTREDHDGAARRGSEVWMMRHVKKFRPKLKTAAISQRNFPLQRKVDTEYGGSDQRVSAEVTEGPSVRNAKDAGIII